MPSPVGEVFAALAACFDSLGIRWYMFGAQAAIYHGVARLTADVDVTILPETHSTSELVSALEASRFRSRVTGTDDFVARTGLSDSRLITTSAICTWPRYFLNPACHVFERKASVDPNDRTRSFGA